MKASQFKRLFKTFISHTANDEEGVDRFIRHTLLLRKTRRALHQKSAHSRSASRTCS